MSLDRREFLRIIGLTGAAGLCGKWVVGAFASDSTSLIEPSPGILRAKRWAMVIDIKKCLDKEGCRDCMNACDQAHNIPQFDNPKDEVKWIWKERFENAFPNEENEFTEDALKDKTIPILCNHCDNPPCVKVCPTQATWKRDDGIVMMDWHRCIGCRYCVAACPYGSRSFNWRDPGPFIKNENNDFPTRTRGVVEKCTFCAERLAVGKMPACVEVCPAKAMVFGDIDDPNSEIRTILRGNYTIRRKTDLGTNPQVYYII
jgi:Fe-S-cluster-containing dehydrogenase component